MPSEPKRTHATNMEMQLLANAAEHSVRRGAFELTAGGSVNWYIAGREVLLDPQMAHAAGKAVYDLLLPEVEGVIGLATAGIIVVAAVQHQTAACCPEPTGAASPRNTAWNGPSKATWPAMSPSWTTPAPRGTPSWNAPKAVESAGSEVVQIISVFDRDQGGEKVRKAGYQYDCVMRLEDGRVVHRMLGRRRVNARQDQARTEPRATQQRSPRCRSSATDSHSRLTCTFGMIQFATLTGTCPTPRPGEQPSRRIPSHAAKPDGSRTGYDGHLRRPAPAKAAGGIIAASARSAGAFSGGK